MSETDGTKQIITATNILHSTRNMISFSAIASFFNVAKGTIQQHWKRPRRGIFPRERPVIIRDEIRPLIFGHITQRFEQGRPVCYDTILDCIYCEQHLTVLSDTLRHLVRRTDAFRTISGIPIESKRCVLTAKVIEDHFNSLAQNIANVPASFIFNIDESGFHEFVDAQEIQVVLPVSLPHDSVTVPVNRSEKRSTMLAAIRADGSYLTPMVIVQRKTYEIDLCESRFTSEAMMIVHRERGSIDRNPFDLWASRVLFSEIERRREHFHYMGDIIVVIEGCTCP